MADVLGLDRSGAPDEPWRAFALFDRAGACVANVDAAILPLVAGGETLAAAAIRSVAVAAPWRGRGLFRDLMGEALDWCDARSCGLTLLFTGEPALYRRFGFRPLAQHAFVGQAPVQVAAPPALPLDLAEQRHRALVARLVAARTPLSRQAALIVPPSLVLANLAAEADAMVAFVEEHDALMVFERDGEVLNLVDVVASGVPPLPDLLGALGRPSARLRTLFPPDRLGWRGEPVEEDTGLMARGTLPAALMRPFMVPPTAEF